MIANDAVVAMIDALEAADAPYMLVGAHACNAYGVPRSTLDADFVVKLESESISKLCARLGDPFRVDPQETFEPMTGSTRHLVHVKDSPFRIELFPLSDDPHDRERFAKRRAAAVWNRRVYHSTAEDMIVTKLHWPILARRTKDTDDVRNVIAVQGDNLDWDYIHRWCEEHGTRALLDQIRQSIPQI